MTSGHSEALDPLALAERVAQEFASLLQVEAVAMAGSRTSGLSDASSDVDLYVYVTEDIPLEWRAGMAAGASRAEIGNATWEPGDEWIDGATGTAMDVMYRQVSWMEEQMDRVLVQHAASVGYSTCFWYNVQHSQALWDRNGWFARLQERAGGPYPAELKRAIIAKNYPLLGRKQSSYLHQIELAVKRRDPVSVNHRVAALLASYFDVLFAVNELPHPGEKRILQHAAASCATMPPGMEHRVWKLAAAVGKTDGEVVEQAQALVDEMDAWLAREHLLPEE